jgi:hypothetical protein
MNDPFRDFTPPQLLAFTYKELGEEGLRRILNVEDTRREFLEKQVDELERIGLSRVAEIVKEIAAQMKYSWDASRCPWPEDYPYPVERRAWLENRERERKEWEASRASRAIST